MDLNRVAARISTQSPTLAGKCAKCGKPLEASEAENAQCSGCLQLGPVQPAVVLAARKKKPAKKVAKPSAINKPSSEYSINVDISLQADFEGTSTKNKLIKKFQSELFAAIKEAVGTTAKELDMRSTGVIVKPIEVGISVVDLSDDYEESDDD